MVETLTFYRKLDLLNRIYILNYCRLDLLESTSIFKLPDDIKDFAIKDQEYLDFGDTTLLVAALPKKRIKFLIDKIILDLIKRDATISLNSKALREIKNYFTPKDMQLLLSNPVKNEEYDFFTEAALKYGIVEVFHHFLKVIFTNIESELGVSIVDRFVPGYKFNEALLKSLETLPYQNLLDNTVERHLPQLKSILN